MTFRLADSLPQARLHEYRRLRQELIDTMHELGGAFTGTRSDSRTAFRSSESVRTSLQRRLEQWLDQGSGSCLLRSPGAFGILGDALEYFHTDWYELGAYVVMPNHVHLVIRPLGSSARPLERILASRKRFTAQAINAALGRGGPLWQDESFDRIVRDGEHLWRCLQYIGRNPLLARLNRGEYRLWLNPDWQKLGWRLETQIASRVAFNAL